MAHQDYLRDDLLQKKNNSLVVIYTRGFTPRNALRSMLFMLRCSSQSVLLCADFSTLFNSQCLCSLQQVITVPPAPLTLWHAPEVPVRYRSVDRRVTAARLVSTAAAPTTRSRSRALPITIAPRVSEAAASNHCQGMLALLLQ